MIRGVARFHVVTAILLLAVGAAVSTQAIFRQRPAATQRASRIARAAAADTERARQRQELLNLARRIDGALGKECWEEATALLREVNRLVVINHYTASAEDNLDGAGWQCVIDTQARQIEIGDCYLYRLQPETALAHFRNASASRGPA